MLFAGYERAPWRSLPSRVSIGVQSGHTRGTRLDGIGWRDAILSLCDPHSSLSVQARAQAELFRPPTWPNYFNRIKAFLAEL